MLFRVGKKTYHKARKGDTKSAKKKMIKDKKISNKKIQLGYFAEL